MDSAQEIYNHVVDEEDLDEYYLQLLEEMVPNFDTQISFEPESDTEQQNKKIKPEMKHDNRRKAIDELLVMEEKGTLPYGSMKKTAQKYGVSRYAIERLWKRACKQRAKGDVIDVRSRKKRTVGRRAKEYTEEFLQSVPLNLRTLVRCFAGALKVSPSAVYRLLKKGKLIIHTSRNRPSLTETHKLERMKWVLSHILPGTPTEQAHFIDMENIININEKWFYLNPDTRRFYLLPREHDPYRCCQSKRFKIKAMFMGVTSKPIYDAQGSLIHDGKFGIFPFVERVTAKKNSKIRDEGTIETKAVEKITQKVIRDMIIQHVLPAIMSKWPAGLSKEIFIQQDNARPHIQGNDETFKAAATQNGFNIKLIQQSAQSSLDLNVLDLGFFRAIQALMYQTFPKNIDELIENVQDWIIVEILKVKGGNNYKNPHHGKARLERLGLLPKNVQCDQVIVDEAVQYLNDKLPNESEELEYFDNEGVIDKE
ncbi:uncharacterized protein LOC104907487 [Beta vulgaris subsp. vulgaris]|uniref:uncharacterized protein LOC104907487 n=1 Tax=Beta vulgaris subsp. vulgaris TaxID=3555 RepID=UPI00053F3B6E|nr:uncharacterized protein LOC104907487 [Beta vulgaris subsp. vulgaris]